MTSFFGFGSTISFLETLASCSSSGSSSSMASVFRETGFSHSRPAKFSATADCFSLFSVCVYISCSCSCSCSCSWMRDGCSLTRKMASLMASIRSLGMAFLMPVDKLSTKAFRLATCLSNRSHSGIKSINSRQDLNAFGDDGALYFRKLFMTMSPAFSSASIMPFKVTSWMACDMASRCHPSSSARFETRVRIVPICVVSGCVNSRMNTSFALSDSSRNFLSFHIRTSIFL